MEYIQKVAAGLRAVKVTPDAFLYCPQGDEVCDRNQICGIPVFYSALVNNTFSDFDVPFIPLWDECSDYAYIIERKRFDSAYTESEAE